MRHCPTHPEDPGPRIPRNGTVRRHQNIHIRPPAERNTYVCVCVVCVCVLCEGECVSVLKVYYMCVCLCCVVLCCVVLCCVVCVCVRGG